jgi:phosphoserine phosphatase RsbU/P
MELSKVHLWKIEMPQHVKMEYKMNKDVHSLLSGSRRATPTILVVDDDDLTRLMLEGLLEEAGFRTVCTGDLAGARRALESGGVSLVLLDVHLPDGSGLEFCRGLSGRSLVPVLFVSANDDVSAKVAGFAAGGVDYIPKPLAGEEVLARVRTHLRLKEAYDALAEMQAERIHLLGNRQQSLMPLPIDLPEARFQVAMRQNNQAGGDFYDVRPIDEHSTDYVVADVSGHDIGSSLWTASFKALLAEYANVLHDPLEICRRINAALMRILPAGAYFSVLYLRLNRRTNRAVLVNAGHPSAVWARARLGQASVVAQDGDLLGVFPDAVFGVREFVVEPGDRLFLYTDGLVERNGAREEGVARLVDICRRSLAESLDDAVFAGLASVCAKDDVDDDIVLLGTEA